MPEPYQILPKRGRNTSKNDYGRLFVIGGSVGYTGAPTLCARAAVRAGAGRVFLGVPESIARASSRRTPCPPSSTA